MGFALLSLDFYTDTLYHLPPSNGEISMTVTSKNFNTDNYDAFLAHARSALLGKTNVLHSYDFFNRMLDPKLPDLEPIEVKKRIRHFECFPNNNEDTIAFLKIVLNEPHPTEEERLAIKNIIANSASEEAQEYLTKARQKLVSQYEKCAERALQICEYVANPIEGLSDQACSIERIFQIVYAERTQLKELITITYRKFLPPQAAAGSAAAPSAAAKK
jgi:hypothetical protein